MTGEGPGTRDARASYRVRRSLYAEDIGSFLARAPEAVLGTLVEASHFDVGLEQRSAWTAEIELLRHALQGLEGRGRIYLEYAVPRLGKWIDAVLVLDHVLFVIEFKVGEVKFHRTAIDQAWDYALDLRNFHETSHAIPIAPMLVATRALPPQFAIATNANDPRMAAPICIGDTQIREAIERTLEFLEGDTLIPDHWERGRYQPTPTIIEAARALYAGHSVDEISRSDAGAVNLTRTSRVIDHIIEDARTHSRKAICFVTGVPGAGKTLVGLDVATRHRDKKSALHSVFLSGNGPLVKVLREALALDHIERQKAKGHKVGKGEARRLVSAFIQNVHHFRDECLRDPTQPPVDHVTLFDEAQRAWDLAQTSFFMRRKKNLPDFAQSEPEFLISCLDRHPDWAVVVCLIGGGQEINTGEAGVSEWIDAMLRGFPEWEVHISPQLRGSEYRAEEGIARLRTCRKVIDHEALHLATSMRSFRAERLSEFVRLVLEQEVEAARDVYRSFADRYPIVLTRSLDKAKRWLRIRARGHERYGIVVSSQAQRLKPHAIDVRPKVDPVHWFLHGRDDVRSSYHLEDVGTEFLVQGLELDWTCVVWDGDLRHSADGWQHHEFKGSKWQRIHKAHRQRYLENAYRVLLTRARQGMVIVVPEGSADDPTRMAKLYDSTYEFLRESGITDASVDEGAL
ncbi:MAG TPA: DUF2075 domain-containing protein [Xanthomonadaceae bacterium]|nr:DUF2075 domain-containing protein [Xanthomonadaceae bacterium]